MNSDNYFKGWENISNSSTELEMASEVEELFGIELNTSNTPNYIEEFQIFPKEFFQRYGNEAPELIESFLNEQLEVGIFEKSYSSLLRYLCLSCDKELAWKTLLRVVSDKDEISKSRVREFLKQSGLADETFKRLEMLRMRKEIKTFWKIFQT